MTWEGCRRKCSLPIAVNATASAWYRKGRGFDLMLVIRFSRSRSLPLFLWLLVPVQYASSRFSFFWDVTQHRLVVSDVSGQHIFQSQAVKANLWLLHQSSDISGNTQMMWAMLGVSVLVVLWAASCYGGGNRTQMRTPRHVPATYSLVCTITCTGICPKDK